MIVARFSDFWLFQETTRLRALPEILSGTLQLRYQAYVYLAFCIRFDPSIAVISGTGLDAPAGF